MITICSEQLLEKILTILFIFLLVTSYFSFYNFSFFI